MKRHCLPCLVLSLVALAGPAGSRAQTSGQVQSDDPTYQAAKDLFDQYAPPEVKAQVDFPSASQINAFLAHLQEALDKGSLDDLAQYEPQARTLLAGLRLSPETADTADWLAARLEEIDAAREIRAQEKAQPQRPPPVGPKPVPPVIGPKPPPAASSSVPYYDVWLRRVRRRLAPANAGELMPTLEKAFASEGAPPQLAWLAEAESSLNPRATSPSGARGLFQLKSETARGLGLSTMLPDERTDPEKSARAAAKYLTELKRRFGSWPLAIAAYNAGEGRVGRLLASEHASTYSEIASSLPSGTRMYVPEVCALCAARGGRPL